MIAVAALAIASGAAACWRASCRDRVGAAVFVVGYLVALAALMVEP